mmetsp:Transcript_27237/g.65597  ORF Transcript_27237/g.65597 Transcript_27237/m.65597 type:complete len:219 (-) Transcript_27237:58-714(-)
MWLEKATPTRRSNSCRASTALDSSGLGRVFLCHICVQASRIASSVRAENLALRILFVSGKNSSKTEMTSKQMFSPSRSQSNQRHKTSASSATSRRCAITAALLILPSSLSPFLSCFTFFSSSAENMSFGGIRPSPTKLVSNRCPTTLVTYTSPSTPSVGRRVLPLKVANRPSSLSYRPRIKARAMDRATEGFSATHTTFMKFSGTMVSPLLSASFHRL